MEKNQGWGRKVKEDEGLDTFARERRWPRKEWDGTMRMRTFLALKQHWVVVAGLIGVVALVVVVDPGKVVQAWAKADVRLVILMLPVVFLLYFCHGLACAQGSGRECGLAPSGASDFYQPGVRFATGRRSLAGTDCQIGRWSRGG